MAERIPYREPIGRWTPRQIFQFSEYVGKRFKKQNEDQRAKHVSSGLISGGKLGQPTLWAVLDMLSVPRSFDEYTLGKFQRGNDVEARAINLLTNLPLQYILDILDGTIDNPGWIAVPEGSMLSGDIYLQYPAAYRGGIGFVDLAQRNNGVRINHEIKSSTKMAYDRVAATGRSKDNTPAPYDHQSIQLAFYCYDEGIDSAFIHYFNADDYRLTTFALNPLDYKEEIDKEIDDIQMAFLTKTLPPYQAFFDYHKAYRKTTFGEWNFLTPNEMMTKLENEYPEAYNKFMNTVLPTGDDSEKTN